MGVEMRQEGNDGASSTYANEDHRPICLGTASLQQNYESDESSECSHNGTVRCTSASETFQNPLKLRESAIKRNLGIKGQKMCCYQLCPSPLHSKKWRIVTPGTSAGGRDWEPLVGQTLCDSCYSTYRKHGTFVRSVRTNEGWFRVDASGAQPSNICAVQPKKSQQASKRQRLETSDDVSSKRHDRKAAMLREETADERGLQV